MNKVIKRLGEFKQKQKGFTLVELIVVIAIIGILAAVMLPKYFGFTDDARKASAISAAKGIRTLMETYYSQGTTAVWPVLNGSTITVNGVTTTLNGTVSTATYTDGRFTYTDNNGWIATSTADGVITATK